MAESKAIELRNIRCSLPKTVLLDAVQLSVKKGTILGITGVSGAGKSSLLKAIAGQLGIETGEIFLNGAKQPPARDLLMPRFKGVSIVNQEFVLSPYHTVSEVIKQHMGGLSEKNQEKFSAELLGLVDLSGQHLQPTHTLSGGEKQRLALICALAEEENLLLLDEPFVHLHNRMRSSVLQYLKALSEVRGTTILLVSHQPEELLSICNEVLWMEKGRVKRKVAALRIFYQPKTQKEAHLFGYYNKIEWRGEVIAFRPNEYSTAEGIGPIPVKFTHSEWMGAFFWNHFVTAQKEAIVLLNFEELYGLEEFYIHPKK